MLIKGKEFTRKKALRWVVIGTAVCILLIVLRWCGSGTPDCSTAEGREAYLHSLGWEIDPASEEYRSVKIPESFDGVMEDYVQMQTEQGFELEKHRGETCGQYCYVVTNYPNCRDTVYAILYVSGKTVLGGDIHTASLSGFMHGLVKK